MRIEPGPFPSKKNNQCYIYSLQSQLLYCFAIKAAGIVRRLVHNNYFRSLLGMFNAVQGKSLASYR